jgi:hypothetical protein
MSRGKFIAAVVASHRRTERAAAKSYREFKWEDSYLEMIVTLHRDAASPWDWRQVAASTPPSAGQEREANARRAIDSYKPSLFERLLGGARSRRAELEAALARARIDDEAEWRETVEQWTWYQRLAQGILEGDLRAYKAVVDNLGPFEELESLGATVKARIVEHWWAEAFVAVKNDAVPTVETKRLASGRFSSKDMPKTKYWALTQDHVCSAAIRVARELFHFLPLSRTYVHVTTVMLNTATGHSGPETVLSVEFDRDRLLGLNFERIDASDAVESFRHAMNFKKTAGFSPVETLQHLVQLTSL